MYLCRFSAKRKNDQISPSTADPAGTAADQHKLLRLTINKFKNQKRFARCWQRITRKESKTRTALKNKLRQLLLLLEERD